MAAAFDFVPALRPGGTTGCTNDEGLHKGIALALLSAISGAYLFIFSKHRSPRGLATYRCRYYLFAAVYFTAWLALSRQRALFRSRPWPPGSRSSVAGLEERRCLRPRPRPSG